MSRRISATLTRKRYSQDFPLEDRLKGLRAEDRLKGIRTEDRLKGLGTEEVEAYLKNSKKERATERTYTYRISDCVFKEAPILSPNQILSHV